MNLENKITRETTYQEVMDFLNSFDDVDGMLLDFLLYDQEMLTTFISNSYIVQSYASFPYDATDIVLELDICSYSQVCLPDVIKRKRQYKFTYSWHFYDIDYIVGDESRLLVVAKWMDFRSAESSFRSVFLGKRKHLLCHPQRGVHIFKQMGQQRRFSFVFNPSCGRFNAAAPCDSAR